MSETFLSGVPEGMRVLVTAGAGGIGRAIADTFVAHGARVHVCDVSREALDECLAAGTMTGNIADVGVEADVDGLFEEVQRNLGGLDVLVNNAGLAGPTAEVEDIEAEEWCRTVDVNLSGQFYCTRRAAPMLKENGEGAIINISSVAGRLGYASRLPYAATKWGVVGITASLAKELGPYGIRVNAILPGIVEGPRIERVIAARAEANGVSYEEMEQEFLSRISLRRMVSAQDVADLAVFLCSSHGRNISGQPMSVCGNVETL